MRNDDIFSERISDLWEIKVKVLNKHLLSCTPFFLIPFEERYVRHLMETNYKDIEEEQVRQALAEDIQTEFLERYHISPKIGFLINHRFVSFIVFLFGFIIMIYHPARQVGVLRFLSALLVVGSFLKFILTIVKGVVED